MYKNHSHCRACNYAFPGAQGIKSNVSEKLIEVLDLGVQPLANDFVNGTDPHAGFAPLKVLYCPRCSLAQLSVVVDPEILYANYSYITSTSDMMKAHFAALWKDIQAERPVSSICEIGSNTGDFLNFCLENGAQRVIGIDPAENLCEIAAAKNVPTINHMFDFQSASEAHARLFGVDCVIARHVFCHVDDWKSFILNLKEMGSKETIYCIEVPYAADTIKMNSWDQIYHEHLSYLTLRSMKALLEGSGLHIHNVQRYPVHGGAIVITLRRDESVETINPEICAEIGNENVTLGDWQAFARRANDQQFRLKATIEVQLAQKKRVAGLGASAKSTVWINACHFGRQQIAFIADNTPQKQYTFSPGTDIPIVDEGAILRDLPDYVVMFAWNYKAEVLEKFKSARAAGVKFIVPVPTIEIV